MNPSFKLVNAILKKPMTIIKGQQVQDILAQCVNNWPHFKELEGTITTNLQKTQDKHLFDTYRSAHDMKYGVYPYSANLILPEPANSWLQELDPTYKVFATGYTASINYKPTYAQVKAMNKFGVNPPATLNAPLSWGQSKYVSYVNPKVPHIWMLQQAQEFVKSIQDVVQTYYNFHVCLGGGVVNKGYSDKDLDVYFLPMGGPGKPTKTKELIQYLIVLCGPAEKIGKSGDYPEQDMPYAAKLKFVYKANDPATNVTTGKRIDVFILASEPVDVDDAISYKAPYVDSKYWANPAGLKMKESVFKNPKQATQATADPSWVNLKCAPIVHRKKGKHT